ncbi:polyketide synthase [Paenibacillus sp. 1011MAR3C5]|uniref:beta-ketoacyl synthase N-terminal-like domain-containing protein n=1 Tax=Paenibacillus sp. 1011MAR3C5 TaxID=1675787 RepID=UPI000E6CB248|nr:beta-ketoacyl synthase N-terminal-like domain-containing protein [Paenibacillus sp. 1011MAR3C5]RJE89656.1 polyketide synthase [Paenibacillus sp. 1011MAR3C5]
MDNVIRTIFESVGAGKLDASTGLELLKSVKKQHPKPSKDIAVIGLALKMPGADNLEQFWSHIVNGRDLIQPYPAARQFDSEGFIRTFTHLKRDNIRYSYGGYLNRVDGFDYSFFNLSPKEASLMDPNQRLFLQAAWEAIEDAGYGGKRIMGSRTGIYLGFADWPVYGQYVSKNFPSQIGTASAGNTPSIMAGRIAHMLDLKGPALLVDTACSSSLVAVHLACTALRNEECEMAIAGGVKVCLLPVEGLYEIGIESSAGRTSAFDDDSDGTVWGEGTVAFLLKPLAKALKDGDPVHAVIKGSAMNQDGASVGLTAPNAAAQEKLLLQAWRDADIDPETIAYIEAHGTGTRLGDPIEADGIRRAFRAFTGKRQFCAIGSVKTNVGHLDAAAGVAGLAKAVAALKYKTLPPTLHFAKPNRNIPFQQSPLYVNDRALGWDTESESYPRRCGVSSFGFSGTNCHIVLEEAPVAAAEDIAGYENDLPYLLVLSAKNKTALEQLTAAYAESLQKQHPSLGDVCYTAATGRGHYSSRLAIIARDLPELREKLAGLADQGLANDERSGVYYGEHRLASAHREARTQGELTTEGLQRLTAEAMECVNRLIERRSSGIEELQQLGERYCLGADVDWNRVYSGDIRMKARLPTYPFQEVRCWVKPLGEDATENPLAILPEHPLSEPLQKLRALAKLTGKPAGGYTDLEHKLANAWSCLLGVEEIDVDDTFFALGGNSILAIQLEVELEKEGILLQSDDLYRYPTIRQAAQWLGQGAAQPLSPEQLQQEEAMSAVASAAEQVNTDEWTAPGDRVILPHMEPFNDLYYRNCFYNSLFPAVRHFGGSIMPFLLNDLIVFDRPGSSGRPFGIDYVSVLPLDELFQLQGLNIITRHDHEHILSETIESLRSGKPVIVWVDSYYEPIRKDTYGKRHVDHTLLIFGFDEELRQFHIMEHDRQENLSYAARTIEYEDLVRSALGFAENFKDHQNRPSHYLLGRAQPTGSTDFIDADPEIFFAKTQLKGRERLEESRHVLMEMAEWVRHIVSTEESFHREAEGLVDLLNDIINAKQVERYRLNEVFGESDELALAFSSMVSSWETVRKSAARYMYMRKYETAAAESIAVKWMELAGSEGDFQLRLFARLSTVLDKVNL